MSVGNTKGYIMPAPVGGYGYDKDGNKYPIKMSGFDTLRLGSKENEKIESIIKRVELRDDIGYFKSFDCINSNVEELIIPQGCKVEIIDCQGSYVKELTLNGYMKRVNCNVNTFITNLEEIRKNKPDMIIHMG